MIEKLKAAADRGIVKLRDFYYSLEVEEEVVIAMVAVVIVIAIGGAFL